ncbi:helix-turn-helix domain-containing protein [Streptomyces sp. NPDC048521]|uniref:helix-turn-helix domain-containing protein n=1 Tax=Streptomyces sp. NPDC048521 TaxID=3365566 RepID=UPI003721CE6D
MYSATQQCPGYAWGTASPPLGERHGTETRRRCRQNEGCVKGTVEPDGARSVPSPGQHIGPAVRAAREARGMSLRALARQIGVSPSFISQLERNKANASVGTLYALVEALDLSLDHLVAAESATTRGAQAVPSGCAAGSPTGGEPDVQVSRFTAVGSPVQRADSRARIRFPGVTWERLTQASDALVDFLHVRYEPGSASCAADDMMRHGGREYGFVLSGRIRVQIGFDTYELSEGDSVTFDSMTPHRLSNESDAPVEAVWFVVGSRDDMRGHTAPSPASDVTHLPSLRT